MKKLYLKTIMFLFLIVTISCNDEVQKFDESYDFSVDNILSFKNEGEIFAYGSITKENRGGFMSFDDLYKKAITQLNEVETEEQHARILKEYSDVITLSDSTYSSLISNGAYRRICNRDRLYVSGNYVHKVFDDQHIIFTEKQNVNALIKIKSVTGIDANLFKVVQYQESIKSAINGRTQADCGVDLSADYFANYAKCRDDRRAWVRAYAYFMISGYNYTPTVFSECWAEIRNGWCNWNQYQNILHSKNCSFTVKATINLNTNYYSRTSTDMPTYNGTTAEWEHLIWAYPAWQQNPDGSFGIPVGSSISWNNGPTPTIQFHAIHMESSSQGVGADDPTHWAVLDCQ